VEPNFEKNVCGAEFWEEYWWSRILRKYLWSQILRRVMVEPNFGNLNKPTFKKNSCKVDFLKRVLVTVTLIVPFSFPSHKTKQLVFIAGLEYSTYKNPLDFLLSNTRRDIIQTYNILNDFCHIHKNLFSNDGLNGSSSLVSMKYKDFLNYSHEIHPR
jgi:hypothetical protein